MKLGLCGNFSINYSWFLLTIKPEFTLDLERAILKVG